MADCQDSVAASGLRVAYADPPYIGQAKLYRDHPDYAGEVDHRELATMLLMYDGWCLHSSSPAMYEVETALRDVGHEDFRHMAWVKPFAAFKRNVSVAYAWEPVFVKAARKPVVKPGMVYRDWLAESITLKRGLTGAKPEAVCRWLFEVMGCEQTDELHDLYPGTGAVSAAWDSWRSQEKARDMTPARSAAFSPGSAVRVKPECDIPPMFRDGPSRGVVESVHEDGTLVVIVDGKAVPYQPEEVETDA